MTSTLNPVKLTQAPQAAGHPIILVAPSDCNPKNLLRLHVAGDAVARRAPHWERHAPIGGCNSSVGRSAARRAELRFRFLTLLQLRFHVTHHDPPGDEVSKRFGYMLKPWLTAAFAAGTRLPVSASVVIIDTDEFLLVPGVISPVAGYPVAQPYAFGSKWIDKMCAGTSAACPVSLSRMEARQHYAIGVPYLLGAADFQAIARRWYSYMQVVVEQMGTKDILADQYAYSLAAHAAGLPHRKSTMMVSNVWSGGEGWDVLETIPRATRCSNVAAAAAAAGARNARRSGYGGSGSPLFLHACQFFTACADGSLPTRSVNNTKGNLGLPAQRGVLRPGQPCTWDQQWTFHKGHVPSDFAMSCDSSLLASPPEDLFAVQTSAQGRRAAFMVCALTTAYNDAAEAACPGGGGCQLRRAVHPAGGAAGRRGRSAHGSGVDGLVSFRSVLTRRRQAQPTHLR